MGGTVLQTCLWGVVFDQWYCITNLSLGGWHCITSCIWSVALYYKLYLIGGTELQAVFEWVALYYKPVFGELYLISGTVLQTCLWVGGIVLQVVFGQWHCITSCLWMSGIVLKTVFDQWHCITNLSLGGWHCITSCIWSVALYCKLYLIGGTVLQTCLWVGGIVLKVVFSQWHCNTISGQVCTGGDR